MRERRPRRLSLGEFSAVTVDQARKWAKTILGRVAHGEDPAAQRAEERTAPIVAEVPRRYLEEHAGPTKKRSSVERPLRLYALPALGRRKVAAVGLKDVADLHHSIRAKPVQANRVLALVSKMLNLAETWGLRSLHSNPCSRIRPAPGGQARAVPLRRRAARGGKGLTRRSRPKPICSEILLPGGQSRPPRACTL